MSYLEGKGVTNFSGVRSKSGRYHFASGAYNASLSIDGLSADVGVGIDDTAGTLMIKGGTTTNWGTVAITPGAMVIGAYTTAGAQVTGLLTTDKLIAFLGSQSSTQITVAHAYCQPAGSLYVSFINATGQATYPAQTITWVRLV